MPVGAGFNAKKTAQSEAAKYRGGVEILYYYYYLIFIVIR
jgi:hypothetical protein